ncbi:methyltransferase RsmF C-terminal domain-like protein [Flavihumibacter profundi]|uniref:methyltransferase RsmF C-terminal domain-like protein n=1 Tax=Flavihumibacter profundi TaxID=2716883 RepID=UPI001CC57E1F|nr:RsmB/NOP family class I SAM-dependent RNA methyltransferase [Flavihumibacter profundi]MBZ5857044.1 RNA methyltransferase [Flavihumibacter profundi]
MTLPEHILQAFINAPGFDQTAFCRVHEEGGQVVSIRLNPTKFNDVAALSFNLGASVPWALQGYYLAERPIFTFEPLLHAGAFYVQEASSMFLEQAIRQCCDLSKGLTVLDLCAAPGGKSTHLLSLISAESVLVSNEVIRSRAAILEENLVKWGNTNSIVTNNDPRDFAALGGMFDVIVIDAPCSGSGMFRRDPESVHGWSVDLVNLCSQRQQRILADAWPALKEGGVLIYSTCSYSVEEDELIADWIAGQLDATTIPLNIDEGWNLVSSSGPVHKSAGYRFYPDKVKGEGFFLAAFRKNVNADMPRKNKSKPKWETVPKNIKEALRPWVNTENLTVINSNENLLALTAATEKCLLQLSSMYIRNAGINLGKWAGKDLVPGHAFALSHLTSSEIPVLSLDRETALNYLRKEEIDAGDMPKGWALVQFMGHSLGWIKQLGNRANNYYPKEWRILKPA